MAGHLASAGADLVVWNRNPEKSEPFLRRRIEVAPTLSDIGSACNTIIFCVNRTEDVQECLDAVLPTVTANTLFIDHSTISPSAALEIHDSLAAKGHRFVDAPITGGSMGAQRGQLTVFCGGTENDVHSAIGVIGPYTKRAERVGGPGAGQQMKVANQIAVAGALLGLCESLSFAKRAGLDVKQTKELLQGGAAGSWAFENYGPKILDSDWSPGFSIKNQVKDLGYCEDAARAANAAIPGAMLTRELLQRYVETGKEEYATAALYEILLDSGFST